MAANSYRTKFCKQCINAGARGYSLTAFAGMLGVSRQKLDHWAERYPSFAEAVGAHKAKRAKFWEGELARIARDGGKTGSTTMVMFALKSVAAEDYGPVTGDAAGEVVNGIVEFFNLQSSTEEVQSLASLVYKNLSGGIVQAKTSATFDSSTAVVTDLRLLAGSGNVTGKIIWSKEKIA